MDTRARQKARKRIKQIEAFREELEELERERALTLTPEQRSRLEAHLEGSVAELKAEFDVDVTSSARWISWGVLVATFLGGAAFCAALVLFLHRIWGALTPVGHSLILLAIPLLLLAAAEFSSRKKGRLYHTALLAIAATAGFIVGTSSLVGIFNVVPSAHLLLAWGSFALLLAHAYGLRLLLAVGLHLLSSYTAALIAMGEGALWINFFERPESLIPSALLIYFLPAFAYRRDRHDFGFVCRLCGAATVFAALLLLSFAGFNSYVGFPERTIETFYQFVGLLLSAGVVGHGIRLARIGLVNLGALAFVVFLYVKLYGWWWDWMPKYLFFLLIGLIAVLLLFVFHRLRTRVSRSS